MAGSTEGTLFKYGVFISYSRKDIDFARKLEAAIETYRPSRDLPVPRRPLKVFRDESDFTGGEYSAALDRNLRDSSKLLVICSPNSRASAFVNDEIDRFSGYRGAENIVSVLLAGLPNNDAKPEQQAQKAFPESLVKLLPIPLAADYRGFNSQHDRPDAGTFENAWHKTIADVYSDYGVTRDQVAGSEVRRRVRRRNTILASGVTLVIGLSLLTGWALFERKEAVRQRDEVQRKEQRLLEAISHITFAFPDELRKLDPAPMVLETVYRNNYELLKALFDKNVTGQMLDDPMAVNVLNLADIWMRQGKLDDATRYLEMIPERHELMSQEEKARSEWQEYLSLAHDRVADIAVRQGDYQRAAEQYRSAFEIRSRWVKAESDSSRWRYLLAGSRSAFCTLDIEQANFELAREQCQKALAEYEKLAQTEAGKADALSGVIWSRMYLADVSEEQGRLPETLEHLSAAGLIIERERADRDLRLELIAWHERRGRALLAMNDVDGAIAESNAALKIGEELSRHGDDADGQKNFAILRHDIATIFKTAGKHREAVQHFDAACKAFSTLLQKDRSSPEWRRLLAECLGDAGEARLEAGQSKEALQDLSQALALRQELAKEQADQPLRQVELAICQRQVGDWYAQRGAYQTAIGKYRLSQEILAGLNGPVANYKKYQGERALTYAKIGKVLSKTRDPSGAIASYKDAVSRYKKLVDEDPTNARWKKGLTETSSTLSELLLASGNREDAASYRALSSASLADRK